MKKERIFLVINFGDEITEISINKNPKVENILGFAHALYHLEPYSFSQANSHSFFRPQLGYYLFQEVDLDPGQLG